MTPGGPPILVGGTGEKKTARLAARYADDWNCNANFVELPRKLAALDGHLADVGRGRDEITVTCLASIVVADTHAAAAEKLSALLDRTAASTTRPPIVGDPDVLHQLLPRLLFGDPDEVIAAGARPRGRRARRRGGEHARRRARSEPR